MSTLSPYRRTNPLMNYLTVALACVGSYLLYLQFVVPIVEVTAELSPHSNSDLDTYPDPVEDIDHHAWFQAGDWEREPCSVLRTAHGRILFDDYSREDPKTWLVHPFTMVLDRQADQESGQPMPPIVLRCQTGARLHFSKPVDGVGGSSFQLERAQLEGSVELYRRIQAFSPDEDLRIETSNIQINEKEIISIEDVAFRFGNNQGVGRHLSMKLSHEGNGTSINRDISRINGITNVRLGILSSMMLKPKSQQKRGDDRLLSHDSTPIEIKSTGPFEFDFNTNLARFIDNVKVRKLDPNGDSLQCDELILQFKSGSGSRVIELNAATDQEFELENVVAIGAPAVLTATSQNATVTGRTLDYHLAKQIIKVSDPKQVEIRKDNDRFVSRTIEYHIQKDRRLGNLSATGPGQLIRNDGGEPFVAHWSQGLKVQRRSDQQHEIQIRGSARLQLDSETRLSAENMDIAIWEVPVYGPNHQLTRWSYQPGQLIASRKVHVTSPKLVADANSLTAIWPDHPQATAVIAREIGQWSNEKHSSAGHFNRQQTMTALNTLRRPRYLSIRQSVPVLASGNDIRIAVKSKGGRSEIDDLVMLGNVTVRKPSVESPDRFEFQINGDRLKLVPVGEDLFEVEVATESKTPARLISEKVRLNGKRLFLNQAQNRIWVDGRGSVQMNSTDRVADRIDVSFKGGMIFDGRKIYFERDVVANLRQSKNQSDSVTNASGTALSITLDRQVDFRQLENRQTDGPQTANPKIIDLTFLQHLPKEKSQFQLASTTLSPPPSVVIRNQILDASGKIIEQLILQAPNARMNEQTSEITASGPGSIQIYRQGANGSAPSGFGFVGRRNSPGKSLIYIHTNFDRQLVANQQTQEIVILGNLRSIYAPVKNFDQAFNPDQPVILPPGSVRLNCDRIDLLRSQNPLSPTAESQFIASGNAHIQSETMDSQADRISYRDNTDLLTFESTTGRNVLLKARRDARSSWDQQIAGAELVYRLKDNTAIIRKVGSASATIGKSP